MTDVTPPSRILVGFEAVGRSDAAVAAALDLRSRLNASVELLHSIELVDARHGTAQIERISDPDDGVGAAVRELAKRRLSEILAEHKEHGVEPDDILTFASGSPAHALVSRAREAGSDLIVLGPHARRGMVDFGGTTRGVLAKASCNVWVQHGPWRQIRNILVPLDLSDESLGALVLGRELAKFYGARVTALHCYVVPAFSYSAAAVEVGAGTSSALIEESRNEDRVAFERALSSFDWRGVEHEQLLVEGFPAAEILGREGVDLIVLGSHGRTGLSAALLGSVAYAVLRKADVPVLAVRVPNRRWRLRE